MANNDRNTRTDTTEKPPIPPALMVVPVRSNRGNITIPYDNGKTGDERVMVGDLFLTAGPNLVPLDKWLAAKRNPSLIALMKGRVPSIRAPEQRPELIGKPIVEEGAPVPAAAPLAALSETEACDLVKDVVDVTLLTQLQAVEHRAPVRRAIETRMVQLKDPSKFMNGAEAAAGSRHATITLE